MISGVWIVSALLWTPWIFAWPYFEQVGTYMFSYIPVTLLPLVFTHNIHIKNQQIMWNDVRMLWDPTISGVVKKQDDTIAYTGLLLFVSFAVLCNISWFI